VKKFQVGVIGCGVIWNAHWKALKSLAGEAEVRYVYDIQAELTEKAAKESGAKGLTDPDEMFDDRDVDIVAILTPPFARVEYVTKACAASKHLMLEKPMARTIEQALQIFHTVQKSGAKCFIPFGRAVNKNWQRVVEIVQSGELGAPHAFVHTALGTPYSWVSLDHWMHNQEKSGGPIFDYSIHFIEFARACMGTEAKEVVYAAGITSGRVKSDDHATLFIYYEGDGVGQFTKSWAFPPGIQSAHHEVTHVVCDAGVISVGKKIELFTDRGVTEFEPMQADSGRAESYRNLITAIEEDTPLYANELNGLRMNEILDAALRSRESGCKEPVSLHE
jgi:UDP-N-acetylglucosamine 3-dehydrogenase